jgi:hypothetical protein
MGAAAGGAAAPDVATLPDVDSAGVAGLAAPSAASESLDRAVGRASVAAVRSSEVCALSRGEHAAARQIATIDQDAPARSGAALCVAISTLAVQRHSLLETTPRRGAK